MAEKTHEEQLKEQQEAQREREARQRTAAAPAAAPAHETPEQKAQREREETVKEKEAYGRTGVAGAGQPNAQAEKDRLQAQIDKQSHPTPGAPPPAYATTAGPLRPANFGEGAVGVLPYAGDTVAPRVSSLWVSEVVKLLEEMPQASGERGEKMKSLIEQGKSAIEGN